MTGNLDKAVNDISSKIQKLLADVEAVIDFADEDLPEKMLLNIKIDVEKSGLGNSSNPAIKPTIIDTYAFSSKNVFE